MFDPGEAVHLTNSAQWGGGWLVFLLKTLFTSPDIKLEDIEKIKQQVKRFKNHNRV